MRKVVWRAMGSRSLSSRPGTVRARRAAASCSILIHRTSKNRKKGHTAPEYASVLYYSKPSRANRIAPRENFARARTVPGRPSRNHLLPPSRWNRARPSDAMMEFPTTDFLTTERSPSLCRPTHASSSRPSDRPSLPVPALSRPSPVRRFRRVPGPAASDPSQGPELSLPEPPEGTVPAQAYREARLDRGACLLRRGHGSLLCGGGAYAPAVPGAQRRSRPCSSPDSGCAAVDAFTVRRSWTWTATGRRWSVLQTTERRQATWGATWSSAVRTAGGLWAFPSGWRTFWDLKTDGTFFYSQAGGSEDGLASIRFTEDGSRPGQAPLRPRRLLPILRLLFGRSGDLQGGVRPALLEAGRKAGRPVARVHSGKHRRPVPAPAQG